MSAYSLVVDDQPGVATLACQKLRRDLRRGRFQMKFAPSRPAALARAVDIEDPSLILSDVNMPGMSGPDMRPKVSATRPGPPVMMITACGGAKAPARGAKRRPTKRSDVSLLRPQIKTRLGQAA